MSLRYFHTGLWAITNLWPRKIVSILSPLMMETRLAISWRKLSVVWPKLFSVINDSHVMPHWIMRFMIGPVWLRFKAFKGVLLRKDLTLETCALRLHSFSQTEALRTKLKWLYDLCFFNFVFVLFNSESHTYQIAIIACLRIISDSLHALF